MYDDTVSAKEMELYHHAHNSFTATTELENDWLTGSSGTDRPTMPQTDIFFFLISSQFPIEHAYWLLKSLIIAVFSELNKKVPLISVICKVDVHFVQQYR